jgi:hypothetical protein
MGAVSFSIDLELVHCCQQVLPLNTFVETGTFEGDSLERIKTLFAEIYSIELSESYYEKAVERFKENSKIKIYQGESPRLLCHLRPQIKDKSTLYWLDAHWCVAEDTAGYESQCPLLEELAAIQSLNSESMVMIDDARLFLCPPPAPHKISQWPSFDEIIKQLYSLSDIHKLMIVNDVMLFYPAKIDQLLKDYAYHNGIDWLVALYKSHHYDDILKEAEARLRVIEDLDRELKNLQAVPKSSQKANSKRQNLFTRLWRK